MKNAALHEIVGCDPSSVAECGACPLGVAGPGSPAHGEARLGVVHPPLGQPRQCAGRAVTEDDLRRGGGAVPTRHNHNHYNPTHILNTS